MRVPSLVVPSGKIATARPAPRSAPISLSALLAARPLPRRSNTVPVRASRTPIAGHAPSSCLETKVAGRTVLSTSTSSQETWLATSRAQCGAGTPARRSSTPNICSSAAVQRRETAARERCSSSGKSTSTVAKPPARCSATRAMRNAARASRSMPRLDKGKRGCADKYPERGAGEHVAGVVQAEHHARRGGEQRERDQQGGEPGIVGQRDHRESHGVQRVA